MATATSTTTSAAANHRQERYNLVTPYQLYISMHEMLVSPANSSSSFNLEQIFDHVSAKDSSLSNVERQIVEKEMRKILLAGVAAGWCRFSKKGGFAPTSSPPDKVELDAAKSKLRSNLTDQTRNGVPSNVIVHGSISDPEKVPGFVVEVDDFIAFMERIGVWPKGSCSGNGGNVNETTRYGLKEKKQTSPLQMQRPKSRLSFGSPGQSYGQQLQDPQQVSNIGAPIPQQQQHSSSIMMSNNRLSDSGPPPFDQQAVNQLTLLKSLLTDLLRLLERYSTQPAQQPFGTQQTFDGSSFNGGLAQQSAQFQANQQQQMQQNQPNFAGQPQFDYSVQQQPTNLQGNVFDSVQNNYKYQGQSSQPQPNRNIYNANNGDSGLIFPGVGQPRINFGQQQQSRPQSTFSNSYMQGNGNEYGMQAQNQQEKLQPPPQQLILQPGSSGSSLQMQPNLGNGQASSGSASSLQNEILQNYNSQASGGLFQPQSAMPQGQNSQLQQQQQLGQGNNIPQTLFDLTGLPQGAVNSNSNQAQMGLKTN